MKLFNEAVVATTSDADAAAAANDNCDECQPGMGGFCGTDDQCHPYTCESFYEFGRQNYTRYDDDAPPLECQDIPITQPGRDDDVFYPSVSFRCRSLVPIPVSMGFNRRCQAITPTSNFTCYELNENTNFQPFLAKVGALEMECTNAEYDETGWPKFTYGTTIENRGVEGSSNINLVLGFNATTEFNETKALTGTMYSRYEERKLPPTQAPTNSACFDVQNIATVGSILVSIIASLAFHLPC
eukprot:CAMPEP_0183702244 /NCGR_PEP_ID=MMETSP0737-20130205/413_1 /TAXON_ID=385413 /ORGANISM="Thalassiosira miniscula, Strain CCMP1093" /LENGTH=241 /DNA_ID=CAMNT_0025928819 /DNA_START=68 /DNA_END=793 /DNA_ORIENTATION=+